jgi:hypothetical protein
MPASDITFPKNDPLFRKSTTPKLLFLGLHRSGLTIAILHRWRVPSNDRILATGGLSPSRMAVRVIVRRGVTRHNHGHAGAARHRESAVDGTDQLQRGSPTDDAFNTFGSHHSVGEQANMVNWKPFSCWSWIVKKRWIEFATVAQGMFPHGMNVYPNVDLANII